MRVPVSLGCCLVTGLTLRCLAGDPQWVSGPLLSLGAGPNPSWQPPSWPVVPLPPGMTNFVLPLRPAFPLTRLPASTNLFLPPGTARVYLSEPYKLLILPGPGLPDPKFVIKPEDGKFALRIIKPDLTLRPRPNPD